jgi:hypothetical protein
MKFLYDIAMRTLLLPGKTLISLFETTVREIAHVPNIQSANIRCDEMLTELVREKCTKAKAFAVQRFEDFIRQPILRLSVLELKGLNKASFI